MFPWLANSKYGTRPAPPTSSSDTPLDKTTPKAHRKSRVDEAEGVAAAAAADKVGVVEDDEGEEGKKHAE